ncbi:MAG: hypothetical protein GPJ51_08285 [Candidatus Heimdallarchaeota archaeon]|nr:hypothetical protein [Candidatus Heimdallarchaeota archaeon]
MTGQIADSFLFNTEVYSLSGISEGELFSPFDYGLFPRAATTACWRGHVLYFTVAGGYLTLVDMEVNAEEEPEINGVKPIIREQSLRLHYQDLNIKLDFSGKIIIAKDFIREMYVHMGFQRSTAYKTVVELEFEKGKFVSEKDLSSKMKKKRRKKPDEGARPKSMEERDMSEWIKGTFSLEYDSTEED